jgi:hypothetical protein
MVKQRRAQDINGLPKEGSAEFEEKQAAALKRVAAKYGG